MVKPTVPDGVDIVPALVAGSTTVAVQVDVPVETGTVEGEHVRVVVVDRRVTVIVNAALVLVA